MGKSPDAFRTISEVAAILEVPAHVLRFWETRFAQVKPVKRAGGRRYYRPDDILLLSGIKALLHEDGLTIKGVQKLLREQGVRHVAALSTLPPGWDGAWDDDGAAPPGRPAGPAPTIVDAILGRALGLAPREPEEDAAAETDFEDEEAAPNLAAQAEDAEPNDLAEDESTDGEVAVASDEGSDDFEPDEPAFATEEAHAWAADDLAGAPPAAMADWDLEASDERDWPGSTTEAAGSGSKFQASLFADGLDAGTSQTAMPDREPAVETPAEPIEAGPEEPAERLLWLLRRADPARLRARAADLAPLLRRLEAAGGEAAPGG